MLRARQCLRLKPAISSLTDAVFRGTRHTTFNIMSAPRKRTTDEPISPPPLKRKAQASISKNAVASFFTPASQKPKERTTWSERSIDGDTPATLLVGRSVPENSEPEAPSKKRRKIAAFDLDSTLISTASGKKHGDDPSDWKWWDSSVPTKLRKMYNDEGYRVVVLSNQAGLTLHPDLNGKAPKNLGKDRVSNFKQKCSAVLTQLGIPTTLYAATAKDIYRKPRTGMWKELCEDYNIPEDEVDLENSVFVGDAGGRTAQLKNGETGAAAVGKDFSCSDRNFAHNVGIDYKTPEEFFLGEQPRDFTRDFDLASHPYSEGGEADKSGDVLFEKKNKQDIVLFCGPPGAGKSTFYWKFLKPLGYERINQDILKTRAKCFKAAGDALSEGGSVAIDNTNRDREGRAEWVELAKKHKVPIRCVWFKTPLQLAQHNDVVRALNKELNPETRTALPSMAFNGYFKNFQEPSAAEGYEDVVEVEFEFRGTKEEYAIWGRYWT